MTQLQRRYGFGPVRSEDLKLSEASGPGQHQNLNDGPSNLDGMDMYEWRVLSYEKYLRKDAALHAYAEKLLRGHARAGQGSTVAATAQAVPDPAPAQPSAPTVSAASAGKLWYIVNGPGAIPAAPAPAPQNSQPASGGATVKLRDCYKLDATVCPGCGSKCEPHEVYCCGKCWLIGGVKAPSDLGVNLARDWIYGYFSGYSGGRPVPEPKAPVIKYPDMCPCQIKSVMCDYHRGL